MFIEVADMRQRDKRLEKEQKGKVFIFFRFA
jgi:hypothetical protein